jgi:AcrR family transcriptional regulator
MTARENFRSTVRMLMRDRLLDAAGELTGDRGWAQVRMSDIAARVGVSRQTVYNEFGSKQALAEALVSRVVDHFLVGVAEQLEQNKDDFPRAIAAAVEFTLRLAGEEPLLKAVLTASRGGADDLLPFLTTESEPLLRGASSVVIGAIEEYWPDLPITGEQREFAVETIVRLVVSHLVMPLTSPEETARQIAWLVYRAVGGPADWGHADTRAASTS